MHFHCDCTRWRATLYLLCIQILTHSVSMDLLNEAWLLVYAYANWNTLGSDNGLLPALCQVIPGSIIPYCWLDTKGQFGFIARFFNTKKNIIKNYHKNSDRLFRPPWNSRSGHSLLAFSLSTSLIYYLYDKECFWCQPTGVITIKEMCYQGRKSGSPIMDIYYVLM